MGNFVGIDPSLRSTGLVALAPDGTVLATAALTPASTLKGIRRAAWVADAVATFATSHAPALVLIEGYAHGGPMLAQMVEVGAMVRDRLESAGARWADVAPARLKKFATGKGNAKKDEIRLAVFKRWGFEAESNDEVDAFVLAALARGVYGSGELTAPQLGVVAAIQKQLQEQKEQEGAERDSGGTVGTGGRTRRAGAGTRKQARGSGPRAGQDRGADGTLPSDRQVARGLDQDEGGGKRVAFEREFCPRATEHFDPSDPLHLISEEVERALPPELEKAVLEAGHAVGLDYFRMGGALLRISEGLYHSEFGCESFKDWLSTRTDMRYGKARRLIRCYSTLVELSIPWEQVKGIGWTKVFLLLDVLDAESVGAWFEKARTLSKRELEAEIAAAMGKGSGGEDGSDGEGDGSTRLAFTLYPDQLEVVREALDEAKREGGTESDSVALEYLCAAWAAGQLDEARAKVRASVEAGRREPKDREEAEECLNSAMEAMARFAKSDRDAMEVLAEVLDVRFPGVEVTFGVDDE
jgi:crossover junction endodeoxyribonuclease RuvC